MATRTGLLLLLLSLLACNVQVDAVLPVSTVRLMYHATDTTTLGLGRLEVLIGGRWGAVCDDLWGDSDASIVCGMIGHAVANPAPAVRTPMFGPSTSDYFLDDVTCPPTATNISECNAVTANISCMPDEPAGVMCVATNPFHQTCGPTLQLVRLPGVPEGMGMVEVRNTTTSNWGTVCDDFWDVLDADVVCKMCNYHTRFPGAYHPRPEGQGLTGASTANYLIDDVQCLGNETDLLSMCPLKFTHDCGPNEKASVTCIHLNNTGQAAPNPEVDCSNDVMTVGFNRTSHPSLTFALLTVNHPSGCLSATDSSNGTHISVRIPMRQCNMGMIQNATHIIYNNTIGVNSTNITIGVAFTNTYVINVRCELNRTANLTGQYTPQEGVLNATATGHYNVTMRFFLNDSFTVPAAPQPLPIPIGDNLNVAVQLSGVYQGVHLVVQSCWASPVHPATSSLWRNLMKDKCRVEPSLRIFPLNYTTFGFRFQTFKFVTSDVIYVNCDAYVCIYGLAVSECDQSCNSTKPTASYPVSAGRRKRDTSSAPQYYVVTSPPVYVYAKPENGGTLSPETSTQRTTTTTTKEPDVNWQWVTVRPASGSQAGGATPGGEVKDEGKGNSPALQGNARLPPESQVLLLEPANAAPAATRCAQASPLALLSLLVWVVVA